jgi:hypothetical protein
MTFEQPSSSPFTSAFVSRRLLINQSIHLFMVSGESISTPPKNPVHVTEKRKIVRANVIRRRLGPLAKLAKVGIAAHSAVLLKPDNGESWVAERNGYFLADKVRV